MAKPKTARTESAGGVVYRKGDTGFQIALVGQTDRNVWGLPKGGPLKGETTEETALREVQEETGLIAHLRKPLDRIEYWFFGRGTRFHKTVHCFLMEAVGGDIAYHDREYDVVQWFDAEQAAAQATYDNERDTIRRAVALLSEQP